LPKVEKNIPILFFSKVTPVRGTAQGHAARGDTSDGVRASRARISERQLA